MARAVDIVRSLAPRAHPTYIAAFEIGDPLLAAHGITTPNRLAHLLAQVLHESGGCKLEFENLNYSAPRLLQIFGVGKHSAAVTEAEARVLSGRPAAIAERVYGLGNPHQARQLGNEKPGDGFRYRGGGLLQTTGRLNYRTTGEKSGVDFEALPALIASPKHALKPVLAEWSTASLNTFADADDFLAISRAIGLGNALSTATPIGMDDRRRWLNKVRPLIDRVDLDGIAPARQQPQGRGRREPDGGGQPEPEGGGMIAMLLGSRVLREGDSGAAVREVQRTLSRLGHNVEPNGRFDVETLAAVAAFQARQGLQTDGTVGRRTAAALDAALEAPRKPGPPRQLLPAES